MQPGLFEDAFVTHFGSFESPFEMPFETQSGAQSGVQSEASYGVRSGAQNNVQSEAPYGVLSEAQNGVLSEALFCTPAHAPFSTFQLSEYKLVIGADEAGRGPLAGPVYAAAAALPGDFPAALLNDSKKMTQKQREYARDVIKERALAWAVDFASPQEIDDINILQASLLAMKRAYLQICGKLDKVLLKHAILLVDGNKTPAVDIACTAIVKGDSKIPEIMAASILAKTERDAFMTQAALEWPQYGFEKHKGYPTRAHVQAIRQYGLCPIHRKTFRLPENY